MRAPITGKLGEKYARSRGAGGLAYPYMIHHAALIAVTGSGRRGEPSPVILTVAKVRSATERGMWSRTSHRRDLCHANAASALCKPNVTAATHFDVLHAGTPPFQGSMPPQSSTLRAAAARKPHCNLSPLH
jgi:hypothetical protein